VHGSTADADGVGAAAAVPVTAGEGVLVAAPTVAVPSADVGDGSAAVGVGVSFSAPHAARVTATPMAIAAMQMRCVHLMAFVPDEASLRSRVNPSLSAAREQLLDAD
jgi:hypothetical protein